MINHANSTHLELLLRFSRASEDSQPTVTVVNSANSDLPSWLTVTFQSTRILLVSTDPYLIVRAEVLPTADEDFSIPTVLACLQAQIPTQLVLSPIAKTDGNPVYYTTATQSEILSSEYAFDVYLYLIRNQSLADTLSEWLNV